MEVVITADAEAAAEVVAASIARVLDHTTGTRARTGDGELAARRLPAIDRGARAWRAVGRARQRRAARRVRRPAARSSRGVPRVHPARVRRPGRPPDERLFGPDVHADDLADACRRYDQLIADLGGVDVQLLGHRERRPRRLQRAGLVARLADADQDARRVPTRADNARFFDDHEEEVPRHVVTQGLGTILEAAPSAAGRVRRRARRQPIARAVEGPLTAMCPASVLQLHPHATVVVDEAGGGRADARRLLPRGVSSTSRSGSSCEHAAIDVRPDDAGRSRSSSTSAESRSRRTSRLALTSIVQLTPAADDPQLASSGSSRATTSSSRPSTAISAAGATWTITGLSLSHLPHHANDGPVSAFLILPDDSTVAGRRANRCAAVASSDARTTSPDVAQTASPDDEPAASSRIPTRAEFVDRAAIPELHVGIVRRVVRSRARLAWDAIADLDPTGRSRAPGRRAAAPSSRRSLDPELAAEEYRLTIDGERGRRRRRWRQRLRHGFVTLGPVARVRSAVACHRGGRAPLRVPRSARRSRPAMVRTGGRRAPDRRRRLAQAVAPPPPPVRRRGMAVAGRGVARAGDGGRRARSRPAAATDAGRRAGSTRTRLHTRRDRPLGRAVPTHSGIVLVPEIDLPAHVHAALTALPALRDPDDASARGQRAVLHRQRARARATRRRCRFVEHVVDAVAELFPTSPWIHIGGDEVPQRAWSGSPIVAAFMLRDRSVVGGRRRVRVPPRSGATIRERTGRRIAPGRKRPSRAASRPVTGTSSAGARSRPPGELCWSFATRRTWRPNETEVPVKALARAEEVFITSTAGGVIPITRVDGAPIGDGHPGPVTTRLKQLYWGRKAEGWLSERVDYRD